MCQIYKFRCLSCEGKVIKAASQKDWRHRERRKASCGVSEGLRGCCPSFAFWHPPLGLSFAFLLAEQVLHKKGGQCFQSAKHTPPKVALCSLPWLAE